MNTIVSLAAVISSAVALGLLDGSDSVSDFTKTVIYSFLFVGCKIMLDVQDISLRSKPK